MSQNIDDLIKSIHIIFKNEGFAGKLFDEQRTALKLLLANYAMNAVTDEDIRKEATSIVNQKHLDTDQ